MSEADAPKLAIYRQLVRGNLRSVTEQMMPRTIELLGAAFDETFDRFLAQIGPRTHYLRDVPHEFLAFAAPLLEDSPAIPAWACDLGRWELAHFAVAAAPKKEHAEPKDLALDRPVLFDDAIRLLHLRFSVHEDPIEARAADLLLYRDAEHAVRTLELSPLASALVERLLRGELLSEATKGACADVACDLDAELLASIARLLADFAERGFLLGSKDAMADCV